MAKLLAFCIPTYNRAEMLRDVIMRLVPLCESTDTDIFVSDNASTDHTQEVMGRIVDEYRFVHYYRQTENIGPDDNFEYVLKMADTKYRWLLSDTCYVNNIDEVVNDLSKEVFDVYILNGAADRAKNLPRTKERYNNSTDVLKDIGWHLTWISCMIYNEDLVNRMDFHHYRNSSFNQTALVFEPTAYGKCHICFNPNVVVNALPLEKESGWNYHVFDIFYKDWYLFVMSLPVFYPYEAKIACIRANAPNAVVLRNMMHAKRRSQGKWRLEDVRRNKFFIKQCGGNYLLFVLMGLCPPKFLDWCFKLGHSYKNIKYGKRNGNCTNV